MTLRRSFAAILVWLVDAAADTGHATTLDQANFDDYIAERKRSNAAFLIMFHVPWCGICQRTFPLFDAASIKVAQAEKAIGFAHVNCETDKPLCERYGVAGFPSIKLFSAGSAEERRDYRGLRTEEGFLKYVDRMLASPVQPLSSVASLQAAMKGEPYPTFVATNDAATANGLIKVAERLMDRHAFLVSPGSIDEVLPGGLAAPDGATLAVVSAAAQQWLGAADEALAVASFFTGSLEDEAAVSAWVEDHRFPGIQALSEDNFYEFTHSQKSTVVVALADPSKPRRDEEEAVRGAASTFPAAEFYFGVINGTHFARHLESFGISEGDQPAVLVTEDNFDVWIEDREALRVAHLTADLVALGAGAPLLRQSRDVRGKLKYYKREAERFAVKMQKYAAEGPKEAGIVIVGCVIALSLLWLVGKLFVSIFTYEEPQRKPSAKKAKGKLLGKLWGKLFKPQLQQSAMPSKSTKAD